MTLHAKGAPGHTSPTCCGDVRVSRVEMNEVKFGRKETFFFPTTVLCACESSRKFTPIFCVSIRFLKPWLNDTTNSQANSSQVTHEIKTCISGWPNRGTAKSSQLARKPFNCLTTTAQSPNNYETTCQESAEVAKRWKTRLELGENLNLIKFKPIRAKWVAKRTQLAPS